MRRPNFFIVGAPKCGTTALYEYLRKHPNIFMPRLKEPHFFATELKGLRRWYIHDEQTYIKLFAEATPTQTAIGEGSVWYLFAQSAIANIKSFNPNAKIIVMLRNPIESLPSLHAHMVYSYVEPQKNFRDAWQMQKMPEKRPVPGLHTYADAGRYAPHIERLNRLFKPEQVKIILFDDFVASPKSAYDETVAFLGLDSDARTDFERVNERRGHRVGAIGWVTHNAPDWVSGGYEKLNQMTGWRFHDAVKKLIARNEAAAAKIPLDDDIRADMADTLRPDIERLGTLLNRDLSAWLI